MRGFAAMLVVAFAIDATAQPAPSTPTAPSAPTAPTAPSAPSAPSAPGSPITSSPPPSTITFHSEGVAAPPPPPSTQLPATLHAAPSPDTISRWHTARVLSVMGSIMSISGTLLTLSSVIYIGATHYPPSTNDILNPQAKPSDPGPVLAYLGASASALGFVLNASALGYEHHLLDELNADPGRGAFGVGTAFGVTGFAGIGFSYFFGLTNYLSPHDQGVAILTTAIAGTALCGIASIIYAADSSRVKKAWAEISTF